MKRVGLVRNRRSAVHSSCSLRKSYPEIQQVSVQLPLLDKSHAQGACPRMSAISNSICGEHNPSVPPSSCRLADVNLSEYSTSRGLSAWPSGMSLPYVILSSPSNVNKAHFRGISHRLSLCTPVSSGIRSPAGRPPALRLRPAGCSVR